MRERFPTPDYLNEDERTWMELAQQAYIAGATKYAPKWRPIEEAPKDGTKIICYLPYGGGFIMQTYWLLDERGGVWHAEGGECDPTHFMPLPELPKDE